MGLWGLIQWLIRGRGHGVEELARRLGMSVADLRAVRPAYREFTIPKRSGGTRRILAPDDQLKALQRLILKRLLARLRSHPAATGFEKGQSIVTNARAHVGQAVVVRMDLKDFFPATRAKKVRKYFRGVGWDRPAAKLLTHLCTFEGGLPQGAPTSPRLSNLVNFRLDARLAGLATRRRVYNPRTAGHLEERPVGATYTRYADDLTFSFPTDDRKLIRYVVRMTKHIVASEGYELHLHRKLRVLRRHTRQQVTGLVVNDWVNLPRATRRWLRAVEHRLATGRAATLTPAQLAGWRALRAMVEAQSEGGARRDG
ncbi:MAG TPA: reverse transcriptase family protein [Gemmataceae bacterium]|nr:reverse transcriptase family protein [Gemmataceae bacterium]